MKHHVIEPLEARIAPAALNFAVDANGSSAVSQAEGNTDTTFVFTVKADAPLSGGATIHYHTSGGSPGDDYAEVTDGVLTFNEGDTQAQISITVHGNTLTQGDRQFTVTLDPGSVTGDITVGGTGSATGIILDDDRTVSISDASTPEGNPGDAKTADFTVTLSAAAEHDTTVFLSTTDGTAHGASGPGQDYDPSGVTQVTILQGHTSATVSVPIIGDTYVGGDETFQVHLTGVKDGVAQLGDKIDGTGTIVDDDTGHQPLPVVKITGPTGPIAEPAGAVGSTTNATFTVSLTNGYESDVNVFYSTHANGDTATEGTDYVGQDHSATDPLVFHSGETSKTIDVAVKQDGIAEHLAETFTLKLNSAATSDNVQLALDSTASSAIATIASEPLPTLSLSVVDANHLPATSTSIVEGNSTSTFAHFQVALSQPSDQDVTFSYSTVDGTAVGGAAAGTGDFQTTTGTVTIHAGDTTAYIDVPITGDTVAEVNENFHFVISNPVHATIATGDQTITILDDDTVYSIVPADDHNVTTVTKHEGTDHTVSFMVQRSDSTLPGSVHVTAAGIAGDNGVRAATAGKDFTVFDQDVTFAAGEVSKTITITINDDNVYEGPEQFNVVLKDGSAVNGIIDPTHNTNTVTIIDDETAPTITISDAVGLEGSLTPSTSGKVTFTVKLSGPSEIPITVDYYTQDGTGPLGATSTGANADFTGISSGSAHTLTIAPNSLTGTFDISTVADDRVEHDETFQVFLTNAQIGTLDPSHSSATGTIKNDDIANVTISPVTMKEGDPSHTMLLTVSVDKVVDYAFDVNFTTMDDVVATRATAGVDYTATTGTVHFSPADFTATGTGTASHTVPVTIIDDSIQESDETFLVKLSGASDPGLKYQSTPGIGTILNDDIGIHVQPVSVVEGNAGQSSAIFTISLDRTLTTGQTLTLHVKSQDGTATGGTGTAGDFTSLDQDITFAAGDTAKTVVVKINGDLISEGVDAQHLYEQFTLQFSDARFSTDGGMTTDARTLSQTSVTGTILDDDPHTSLVSVTPVNATLAEGAATDHGTATFNVSLTTALQHPVTVTYTTSVTSVGGTPVPVEHTVVIPAGQLSTTVSVGYDGNDAIGHDQIALVTLTKAEVTLNQGETDVTTVNLSNTGKTAQTQILDDDAAITITGPAAANEGAAGTTHVMNFTVTIPQALDHDVVVNYSTNDGTATASTASAVGDYIGAAAGSKITIPAGKTSAIIPITVIGDNVAGADETFTVTLTSPTGAKLGTATATGVILNDDGPAPTVSITEASGSEGGTVDFIVKLSKASDTPVQISYHTTDGTALGGTDYTAVTTGAQTLTIAPGATAGKISIATTQDTENEGDETFQVTLDNASFGTLDPAHLSATGHILPSDLPTLSFVGSTLTFLEGNFNSANQNVTVQVTGGTVTNAIGFTISTVDGTATAGSDYTAITSQHFTIGPGQTSIQIPVSVLGDLNIEPNETFKINLTLDDNAPAVLGSGQGSVTATIVNDDTSIQIQNPSQASSATVTVNEGDGFAHFNVTRTDGNGTATVHYKTQDGTAKSGISPDYRALEGDLTFAPGQTSIDLAIPIVDDDHREASESFTVVLSNPTNAVLATQTTGTVNIADNDGVPLVTVSTPAPVLEGNSGTRAMNFTISLNHANDLEAVTVNYATLDETAHAGSDYQDLTGSVTFAPGETSKTITVLVNSDLTYDSSPRETLGFDVSLATPNTATFGTDANGHALTHITSHGTIIDDDAPPVVTVSAATAVEGSNLGFVVSLSHASDLPVQVGFYTTDGTATSKGVGGIDYAAVSKTSGQTITFDPGQTSQQIVIATTQDIIAEPAESFHVHLFAPQHAKLTAKSSVATGTITDDDHAYISINDPTVSEGNNGTTNAVFHVTLSAQSSTPVTVHYSTVNGTATAGSDFLARSGTLVFKPGETTKDIFVPVKGDQADESDETFTVQLSAPKNALLARDTGTGTIVDDDSGPTLFLTGDHVRNGHPSVVEGNIVNGTADVTTITYTPKLSAPATQDITFTISTAPAPGVRGVAQAGLDYTGHAVTTNGVTSFQPLTKTMTIKAGNVVPTTSSGAADTFLVDVTGDNVFEDTENFVVRITNISGPAQAGDTTLTTTIYNDDVFASPHVVKWSDVDGELVTLKVSKGNLLTAGFSLDPTNNPADTFDYGGKTLTQLNLAQQQFLRANVSITSSPQPGFPTFGVKQDGLVNVGLIRSNNLTGLGNMLELQGVDLGVVTVQGDVSNIIAGDLFTDTAIQALNVKSMGVRDPGNLSIVVGPIGRVNIAGDMQGNLQVVGNGFGNITSLHIGGALNGFVSGLTDPNDNNVGSITATGGITSASIGSIIGGTGDNSGALTATAIQTLTVHGKVQGGTGANTGVVFAASSMRTVSIEGSLIAGSGTGSGIIQANTNLNSIHIGGDLDNRNGPTDGSVSNPLLVPGNETGAIIAGKIGSVTIDGSINQGRIVTSGSLGSVTIGQDFIGTSSRTALIVAGGVNADTTIASVLVKGQAANAKILGGWTRDVQGNGNVLYTPVNADAQIGTVEVDGNVQGLDIVAGAMPGTFTAAKGTQGSTTDPFTPRSFTDGVFGTTDDLVITNVGAGLIDKAGVSSKIALVIFNGSVLADASAHGIVAEQVDTVIVDGDFLPLNGGKVPVTVSPTATNFMVQQLP